MGILYRQFLNSESSEGNALTAVSVVGGSTIQEVYASLDLSISFTSCSVTGHFSFDVYLYKDEDKEGQNLDRLGEAEDKIAKLKRAVEIAEEEIQIFRNKVTDKNGYVTFKKAKKKKKQP